MQSVVDPENKPDLNHFFQGKGLSIDDSCHKLCKSRHVETQNPNHVWINPMNLIQSKKLCESKDLFGRNVTKDFQQANQRVPFGKSKSNPAGVGQGITISNKKMKH